MPGTFYTGMPGPLAVEKLDALWDMSGTVTTLSDYYLGPKAVAPTTNNSGGILVSGVSYWNSTSNEYFIYNGSTWVAPATQAASSATSAATSYDSFDDRYLGPKASAPTLDNDGAALLTGAMYWNTGTNRLLYWTGSVWSDPVTTAATSATNASNSATAAATSATAAAASYDAFDDRYLGSKASNPTLDNDGAALLTGAIYWNTTSNEMRVWTGSTWVATYIPAGSYVVGPASVTDSTIALFDGTTGKLLKDSSLTIPVLPIILPSLNLDFVNSRVLDPRITFSRASSASYVDRDGYLKLASSGSPRFDYDPVTLQPKGLLIEEQRTNLLTYSESFDNAAWTSTRTTVSANLAVAPDGTNTADKLVEDSSASATHLIARSDAVSSGATVTISVFAKASGRSWFVIYEGASAVGRFFDLANGVTGSVFIGTPASSSIQSVGNGWYRCSITTTVPLTTTTTRFYTANADGGSSYTGDGTSGIYIWGAQLEQGAYPTSYIPTTTAQVTRAADVASMTGTNFSSWYNQSEGTLFAEYDRVGFGTSGNFAAAAWLNTSAVAYAEWASVGGLSNGTALATSGYSGAANQWYSSQSKSAVPNVFGKVVVGYATNNTGSSFNGSAAFVDTSCVMPNGANVLIIGGDLASGATYLNGHIKRIVCYPKRLSNTELQGITA